MNKQHYYELFFDQDEVLVNLSKQVINHYNKDFNDDFDYKLNKSYWWLDCPKSNKSYFQKLLLQQGVFLDAPPVEDTIEILNKLYNEDFNIHIITLPQWNSLYCVKEKVDWVQKYLPFINIETNFHMTGYKGIMAKSNRILLDDNINHLNSWKENGGISIAFKDFNWNSEWKNYRVQSHEEFYDLIHKLEKNKQEGDF